MIFAETTPADATGAIVPQPQLLPMDQVYPPDGSNYPNPPMEDMIDPNSAGHPYYDPGLVELDTWEALNVAEAAAVDAQQDLAKQIAALDPPPSLQPVMPDPVPGPGGTPSGGSNLGWWILGTLVLAGAGVGGYFLVKRYRGMHPVPA